MTVNATYTPPQYSCDGVTTAFAFSFPFFAASDLIVTLFNSGLQVLASPQPVLNGGAVYDYTVTGTRDAATGEYTGGATVTLNTPPPPLYTVTIERDVGDTQQASYTPNGPFPAKTMESGLDRLTMIVQRLRNLATRAIRTPVVDGVLDMTLPPIAQRAGLWAAYDESGLPTAAAAPNGAVAISSAMTSIVGAASTSAALAMLGGAIPFATIAALRAYTGTAPPVIFVLGYYTAFDGGEGAFVQANGPADDGGRVIVDGSSRAWRRLLAGAPATVKHYGAKLDGVTDDTTAIQAALTHASPGDTILMPPGTGLFSTMLSLSQNGVKLIGASGGDQHDTGTQVVSPSRLLWNGSVGGTMMQVKSATTQFIAGCEVRDICFDGNNRKAAIGLQVLSGRKHVIDITGVHTTGKILDLGIDGGLSEPAGLTENRIRITAYQNVAGDGAILTIEGSVSWDCSQNVYELISGDFLNGPAVNVVDADSETFQLVKLYQLGGGSDVGVRLNAGPSASRCARNCMFHYLGVSSANAPLYAAGTESDTSPSSQNSILFLDTANNPLAPSMGTAATLGWASIKAPPGLRSMTVAVNSGNIVNSGGAINQSGLTGTIAGGGTLAVTLPTPLPTGPYKVNVTPKTPVVFSADCSATTLTIINSSTAAASAFRWEVEGF